MKTIRLTEEIIKQQIRYENADGEHTFTMCKCGRRGCRGILCVLCWEEKLKEVKLE